MTAKGNAAVVRLPRVPRPVRRASAVGRRDPRLGHTELEAFKLTRVLGRGTFGTAYLAEQLGTERRAVVKIAHADLVEGETGTEVRARFDSEVRAATRVSHPNLVTIYTSGETDDGLPAIAMEYVEGETLGRVLSREETLGDELFEVFDQVGSALYAIHEEGVLHRDVAPGNVMISRDHSGDVRAVLLDFGMARLADLPGTSLSPVGTPHFVAPEQLISRPEPASDVFSLGALLWWALCGSRMRTDRRGCPLGSPVVNPAYDAQLEPLLRSMVEPEPERRPAIGEFLDHWRAIFLRELPRPSSLAPMTIAPTTQRIPKALVVEPNVVLRRMLGKVAKRAGFSARLWEEAQASENISQFSVIIASSRCGAAEMNELLECRRIFAPHATLIVADHGDDVPWADEADTEVQVPGELRALEEHLASMVADGSVHRQARQNHEAAEVQLSSRQASSAQPEGSFSRASFIGMIPELLFELRAAADQNDDNEAALLCDAISMQAIGAGAKELHGLARMYRELLLASIETDIGSIADELEDAYREAFSSLLP